MMARRIASLRDRLSDEKRRDALSGLTTTERLLALLLVELMETRAHHTLRELEARLLVAGISREASAALLSTSTATLSVLESREKSQAVDAVDPVGGSGQGGPRATDPSLAVSSSTEQTTKDEG